MGIIQAIDTCMRMRTSPKLKMQENIASMSLTILVGDHACNKISPSEIMHAHMWLSHKCEFGKGR